MVDSSCLFHLKEVLFCAVRIFAYQDLVGPYLQEIWQEKTTLDFYKHGRIL